MVAITAALAASSNGFGASCPPWRVVDSPRPTGSWSNLEGVAAAGPRDIWAVGRILRGGHVPNPLAMHWDGETWSLVPVETDMLAGFEDIARVPGIRSPRFWAVGQSIACEGCVAQDKTFAAFWNGRAWVVVPTPNVGGGDNWLSGVTALARDDVWAVGAYAEGADFEEEDSTVRTLVLHWNGRRWKVVPSPSRPAPPDYLEGIEAFDMLEGVVAVNTHNIWSVGTTFAPTDRPLVERWNGSGWRIVRAPGHPEGGHTFVESVDALDRGNVWAVGSALVAGDRDFAPFIMRWDGTGWRFVPAPAATTYPAAWPFPRNARLEGVSVVSPTKVWAVGTRSRYVRDESGMWHHASSPLILRWNGRAWNVASDAFPDWRPTESGFLADVVRVPGTDQEWAVGRLETSSDGSVSSRPLIVRHC